MSRLALLLLLLPCLSFAKPWQGITPGASSEIDVVGKFGEPTKRLTVKSQLVLLYSGIQVIKGTVQVQFKCDPKTKEVQRIDVYPAVAIDADAISTSYGKSCESTGGTEPCFWKKTAAGKVYFLYAKLGLAIFFKEDEKSVLSMAFLPPQV